MIKYDEVERVWHEALISFTWRNQVKTSQSLVRIASAPTKAQNGYLFITRQLCVTAKLACSPNCYVSESTLLILNGTQIQGEVNGLWLNERVRNVTVMLQIVSVWCNEYQHNMFL
jgi:hypothetical protein